MMEIVIGFTGGVIATCLLRNGKHWWCYNAASVKTMNDNYNYHTPDGNELYEEALRQLYHQKPVSSESFDILYEVITQKRKLSKRPLGNVPTDTVMKVISDMVDRHMAGYIGILDHSIEQRFDKLEGVIKSSSTPTTYEGTEKE